MAEALVMRPPETHEEDALVALLGAALHFPAGGMRDWMTLLGPQHFRGVWTRGDLAAGLGLIHMGQWFGGVVVPMVGVTAVGVAPQQRSTGVGSAMLREMLAELHAQGAPLSALYPATVPFYQRAGYERAGSRISYEMPLELIDIRDQSLELVPVSANDYALLRASYDQRAAQTAGNLDRPSWLWQLRIAPKDREMFRFVVMNQGQPEGYIAYFQGIRNDPLTITDLCITSAAAGRRLLTFLAGYRSMVEHVVWNGGPVDPFVYLLREQLTAVTKPRIKIARSFDWMLRLVNVPQALRLRGYPPGVRAELHLDVQDALVPANHGRFVLQVADGQAVVEPGGSGRITLDVRGLAALYSGFWTPSELAFIDHISGSPADLALLGAVLSGPRPWIGDMF